MIFVAGIDLSTFAVDIVKVPYEGVGQPVWNRFDLVGSDAFDRTRSVADSMPGRASVFWDDVLAVGIEHPAGKYGVGDMMRVQGAILSCIPARMLTHALPPGRWRKLNGIAGNASKDDVHYHSFALRLMPEPDPWIYQDAHDAHLIARAVRSLIQEPQAA